MKEKGQIFDIQRYSLHDGGGIRTIIFFSGCPLRCQWCSNPESQQLSSQIFFWKVRCIGCGACQTACPFSLGCAGVNGKQCMHCGKCVDACHTNALTFSGRKMSVEDVMQIVKRDTTFYGTSGGGVTLSGGEALVQWEFARAIAHRLQMMMIDVAIETTGYAKWEHAWSVYQYCDRILYDMKVMDSDKHLQYTGVRNELILENAARLAKTGKKVIYRVPLIEGVNNDDQNILQLCALAKENHVSEIHLLPYHEYGKPKYTALNREYTFAASTPTDENIQHLTELIASQGIRCVKGGE